MTDLVLNNVPPGPEGRAFIKQLRKYLPPEYRIRTRGCNKNRKELAIARAKRRGTDVAVEHKLMRQQVPCYLADRIRVYIYHRTYENGIAFDGARWYYCPWTSGLQPQRLGPFKTRDIALATKKLHEGTTRKERK